MKNHRSDGTYGYGEIGPITRGIPIFHRLGSAQAQGAVYGGGSLRPEAALREDAGPGKGSYALGTEGAIVPRSRDRHRPLDLNGKIIKAPVHTCWAAACSTDPRLRLGFLRRKAGLVPEDVRRGGEKYADQGSRAS